MTNIAQNYPELPSYIFETGIETIKQIYPDAFSKNAENSNKDDEINIVIDEKFVDKMWENIKRDNKDAELSQLVETLYKENYLSEEGAREYEKNKEKIVPLIVTDIFIILTEEIDKGA